MKKLIPKNLKLSSKIESVDFEKIRDIWLVVVTYWEDMNKFLKIATYLKKVWRDVVFVNGTDEEYIQQILDYNEEAEHDDSCDSLASLIRLLWQRKNENESNTLSMWGF